MTHRYACNDTLKFTLSGSGDFIVKQLSTEATAESFEDGSADSIMFVVHFRPPLQRSDGSKYRLDVHYTGERVARTLGGGASNHIFGHHVAAIAGAVAVPLVLRPEELEYELYPTHQLRVTPSTIASLYLTICNNMTATAAQGVAEDLVLETQVKAIGGDRRIVSLAWFPPDVDPALYGLRIDTRKIPQRSPLWFKLRGVVSGSKAYALLGYFVPPPAPPQSGGAPPPYNFYKGTPFSSFARSAMRLGTISEDAALLTYLHAFPDRTFYELGWCPLPSPPAPSGWGASPDGLFEDPDMTSWDTIPAEVAAHYSEEERRVPPRRGACEFKTSRAKTCMEAYFYPQVYMEMMALNVVWCDLVRYRPGVAAHVYRVYRHKPTEEMLMRLWRNAIDNVARIQEVVHDGPAGEYTRARAYFDKMAAEHKPYRVIEAREVAAKLQAYEAQKKQMATPLAPPPAPLVGADAGAAEEWDAVFSATQEIEKTLKRRGKASDDDTRSGLKRLAISQLENYTRILKKLV